MKPISFKEQTKILNKPEGMTDKECSPLPVWNGDGQRCISCWKANLKERLLFLFTGKMWLWIWYGQTQPPVCVDIMHPFKKSFFKEKFTDTILELGKKVERWESIIERRTDETS